MADIRKAEVIVADFTHHKGGVYFEAGFGLGLDRTVVFTCREDDFRSGAGVHFDTRPYNHILWSTDDLGGFRENLYSTASKHGSVTQEGTSRMTAAIYARKSTDQSGTTDEQRSVARQLDHARAFAIGKGWTVGDEYVYVDDGISGAEFERRPAFLRMMNTLRPRPAFDVIVMSEESRLGREAIETAYALKQIISAGVRVFFYLENRERTFETATDKLLMSVTAFADELEREKARQRTYDAMQRKAKAGHVTGGRVFGYDNLQIAGDDGKRSHVERRINAREAAIVGQIFELTAAGYGRNRVVQVLNAAGEVSPRAQRGRPSAWCPSTVHEALHRGCTAA